MAQENAVCTMLKDFCFKNISAASALSTGRTTL